MHHPKVKWRVRKFIVLVNYSRYMWTRPPHMIQPLTRLNLENIPFRWTSIEQDSFKEIKCIVTRDVLTTHQNFNKLFYYRAKYVKCELDFNSEEINEMVTK